MAYSVRGKFINQNKYSTRRVNQLLDLTAIQAKDSLIIEQEAQKAIDKASKAAKKSRRIGFLRKAISPFTPIVGDAILGLVDATVSDRLRSKSIRGIDQSKVTYLGDAAANADRRVKQATKEITKGMKFGDKALDVATDIGVKQALSAINNSEAYAEHKKNVEKIMQDKKFGEGKLIDLARESKNFYVDEMKKFFGDSSKYLEANINYQNRNNPNKLLLDFLTEQETKGNE